MTSEYKPKEYLPTIDAILGVADLEKVSVKKIRRALQELFAINLDEHKSSINELILERYHNLADERKQQNDKSEKQRREEMIKQDAILALKLSKEMSVPVRNALNRKKPSKVTKTKKSTSSEDKPKRKSVFQREVQLSAPLSEIIGVTSAPRGQVVKLLWQYIKGNKLQDPNSGRTILCDEKLENLFKKKKVDSFAMQKDLVKHMFYDKELAEKKEAAEAAAAAYSSVEPSASPVPSSRSPEEDQFSESSEED
ncbi:SWIB-domain-containing protein [Yamadazyma tenuis ATCC 10573]|uniref:SWIB-domain-containing protein n=1 Tax=Candida tenuis (strain ATCC 10573 / BCRC 21748 / CBS 615 / JCM 9827 / NBRC 10315 / NRRL Y-1498 / VKM Y-70) TaxID=590646 RepID=G3B1F9_CANTC|nr:uncharacterized protein CANTEDRAFT_121207 [Yamadazyma tenuis ATCC 10573]XP_006685770.1 SWIB-domain-containing protein [Yamadazyma tenuis ATCC 10573]EGV64963.1 hypothetical protein CANTEDRAFT_121207 [Yamadazyma tenuis ATCC 10573]EGV64964.1 SWIB-domain-containing protein [Yamadazyma tenuis ATCC 10573]